MTREEFDRWWSDAKPRERDAAVAEKVMGWVKDEYRHGYWFTRPGSVPRLPKFSTDVAAAWQVFQAVMGKLFSVRHRFFDALADEAKPSDGQQTYGLWALQTLKDRFPEAICRAALLACCPDGQEGGVCIWCGAYAESEGGALCPYSADRCRADWECVDIALIGLVYGVSLTLLVVMAVYGLFFAK